METLIITGGAGFIGSNLVRFILDQKNYKIINIDKLTYAGHTESLMDVSSSPLYEFIKADIRDTGYVKDVLKNYKPIAIIHLAAETHVDRSIDRPSRFFRTNVEGTFVLLEQALNYWLSLPVHKKEIFRFIHISTDEVFGALDEEGIFTESSPYSPRSPYSASKAASDHFVWAWHHTYGFPSIITYCTNNFGPFQYPEKLIPLTILRAIRKMSIPIYGKGLNVRDWIFVYDHVRAIVKALEKGRPGEKYFISAGNEKKNIEVVNEICEILDHELPDKDIFSYKKLIEYVDDRPGHDYRYALDSSKTRKKLGWKPIVSFRQGLKKTVRWYLDNLNWCDVVTKRRYNLSRLGLIYNLDKNQKVKIG